MTLFYQHLNDHNMCVHYGLTTSYWTLLGVYGWYLLVSGNGVMLFFSVVALRTGKEKRPFGQYNWYT